MVQFSTQIIFYEANEGKLIVRPVETSVDATTGAITKTALQSLDLRLTIYDDDAYSSPISGLTDLSFTEEAPGTYQVITPGASIPAVGTEIYGQITEAGSYANKLRFRFVRTVQERKL